MGKFTTEKLNVAANELGDYDVDNTGAVDVIVNVNGDWRHSYSRGGQRLFTDEEIRNIRTLRPTRTLRELADMFDCSHILIRGICKRFNYEDVI